MIDDIRFLLGTFRVKDRALLVLLVFGQFLASLMDLLGLAAVLPLMDVLLGADMAQGYLGTLSRWLGAPSREEFVVTMAVVMVAAFAVKAAASLSLGWWSSGLVIRLQMGTASRLLRRFLDQDYLDYRRSNMAEMIRVLDAGVGDAHGKVLGGLLGLSASILSMGAILGLLVVVSPLATLAAVAYFGLVVFVIQRFLTARNRSAGAAAVEAAWRRSFALINAVSGFREIRMHNVSQDFIRRFDQANEEAGSAARRAIMYGSAPRYLLEVAAITGIGVLLAVLATTRGTESVMPTVSLFIAASIKLLPSMSGLTSTLGSVQNGRAGLELVVVNLRRTEPVTERVSLGMLKGDADPQLREIDIDNVSFRYPDGREPVLKGVTLRIPPGTALAVCGASGSGKTTLVDVILGLITPDEGEVRYGGETPAELGALWRELVAYVPQDVYLIDDTVEANVAFGIPLERRDRSRVIEALRMAELESLVAQLPGGLESMLGERGSRLSGGQRQRIGIARALYRRPKVIVLDEATSALDNETEDRVARTIQELSGKVTTVIVAHRLSTVRHVDQLVFLSGGAVQSVGSFDEVRVESREFARLVELGNLDAPH